MRVLTSSGASLRFIKKRFRPSKRGFGNSLSKSDILKSRRGQEGGPLLEANVSAESMHFMQNSESSRNRAKS